MGDAAAEADHERSEPKPVTWETVLNAEHVAINERRPEGRPVEARNLVSQMAYGESGEFDTIGLALSGGGIRSAAFCLGVVQALADRKQFEHVDYLSTVSGGGYIGSALASRMSRCDGIFPFPSTKEDLKDPPSLTHIRDYANYLIPFGSKSLITDFAVVIRGLVTNVILVLPVLLILASLTLLIKPTIASLPVPLVPGLAAISKHFTLTILILGLDFIFFAIWSIHSLTNGAQLSELKNRFKYVAAVAFAVTTVVALCELQPVLLGDMTSAGPLRGVWYLDRITKITTVLAPIAAILSFFSRHIGDVFGHGRGDRIPSLLKQVAARGAIWFVALTLPVFLWLCYLYLVVWGLEGCNPDYLLCKLRGSWGILHRSSIVWWYVLFAITMMATWKWLKPNGNSLHRLYRDRLAEAFLLSTYKPPVTDLQTDAEDVQFNATVMKLSDLDASRAPYLLINAALNIEGAKTANMRGRNADFFVFSKLFTGSVESGYLPTTDWEAEDDALTLATAMAISGAAVSSNMGAESIGPMAPTLALLNLRLGYWLANVAAPHQRLNRLYLAKEMFSNLKPDDPWLYLTDGGHIDNTGIYELLRRRCATIIAVDAEADPEMVFPSFVKLQRHARIDLGVRINLRWNKIAAATLGATVEGAKPAAGPHCAVGDITYSNGGKGKLIYIKASLTGDENAYILDYARRYPAFPHETTGDQFFTEEQFEVYRALGFHCVNGVYKSRRERPDKIEVSRAGVETKGTSLRFADVRVLRPWNY